jgi:Sulfotransferase domain
MIYIVSGLPRSGTSLAMQMLAAGGVPVLADGVRAADANNPRGYYEWERIKQLPQEPRFIAEAEGKAVKAISSLLFTLPADREYRVLFLLRPIEEIVASQAAMISSLGTQGPALPAAAMKAALQAHRNQALAWLDRQAHLRVLKLDYLELLADPAVSARKMASFLGLPLDTEAMARQVDRSLHRQRLGKEIPDAG